MKKTRNRLRILEICEFSSGICGVWQRVKQEAQELSKRGHKVYVFSSELEKGTEKIINSIDKSGKIEIYRFKATRNNARSLAANIKNKIIDYFEN